MMGTSEEMSPPPIACVVKCRRVVVASAGQIKGRSGPPEAERAKAATRAASSAIEDAEAMVASEAEGAEAKALPATASVETTASPPMEGPAALAFPAMQGAEAMASRAMEDAEATEAEAEVAEVEEAQA